MPLIFGTPEANARLEMDRKYRKYIRACETGAVERIREVREEIFTLEDEIASLKFLLADARGRYQHLKQEFGL